ncbi:MAG: helix-turn-helix transcriptional regulator [Bacteroidaceae bacterium]|nr:helix-turn-helix transcriptional regulator [Bacteroidaceae bacterium]
MAMTFDLYKLRKDYKLTQKDVAKMLSLPQSSVSAMENGKTAVSQRVKDILSAELSIENIDNYNVRENVSINNNHVNGNYNGYVNGAVVDDQLQAKIDLILKDVSSLVERREERISALESRIDTLQEQLLQKNEEIMNLKLLLLQNNIEF